jgi:3-hydroxyisobutyrate dehydrogenase-like beta-hydroxyacid dehydrogenase
VRARSSSTTCWPRSTWPAPAEALALAERVGLDPARTLDVIAQSSGQSWIGSDRMARALAGDLAPRAHTTLLAKDTGLAIGMAIDAGYDAVLGRVAAEAFDSACRAGCWRARRRLSAAAVARAARAA